MVLLNSRQGHFSAALARSASGLRHRPGRSFSRSYGAILPSSLTRVLPIALGCSPRPPVSVCGTGTWVSSLRGFSWQHGLSHISPVKGITITPQAPIADLPTIFIALQAWHDSISEPSLAYPSASPHRSTQVVQEY